MKSCFEVIADAVEMFRHSDEYAYFYGAKGQVLTDSMMEALVKCEPGYFKKYSESDLKKIFDFSRGKIGLDCSGFITAATGIRNYSTGFINSARNVTTPAAGTWGNILYTTFGGSGRHIGLDIGAGRFLHMGREGYSIEFGLIKNFAWEKSGQINGIDYFMAANT